LVLRVRKTKNFPDLACSTTMEDFRIPVPQIDETPDPHAHVDALVNRAQNLLGFMGDDAAIVVLIDSGVPGEEAYLAVSAAKLLNKDKEP
jgi:hypothetical protein